MALLVLLLQASSGTADTLHALPDFLSSRAGFAAAFADQIAQCVARHDTSHPVFHGCVDWHSAVHGVWALTAYTRITGDDKYVPLIESTLSSTPLEAERAYLSANRYFEMPYGRAWFLRLAQEHMRTFSSDLLSEFADEVADSIVDYYTQHIPNPSAREYENSSWALLSLYDYARYKRDPRLLAFVTYIVERYYMSPSDQVCPALEKESLWSDFMAVCTNWAMLVSRIAARESFRKWVQIFLPADRQMIPVMKPRNPHHYGLNFSRAWGLWALYEATTDSRFRDSFLGHFHQNYTRREWWAGDYGSVGHWVAQFGMFAIATTYDDDLSGNPDIE